METINIEEINKDPTKENKNETFNYKKELKEMQTSLKNIFKLLKIDE